MRGVPLFFSFPAGRSPFFFFFHYKGSRSFARLGDAFFFFFLGANFFCGRIKSVIPPGLFLFSLRKSGPFSVRISFFFFPERKLLFFGSSWGLLSPRPGSGRRAFSSLSSLNICDFLFFFRAFGKPPFSSRKAHATPRPMHFGFFFRLQAIPLEGPGRVLFFLCTRASQNFFLEVFCEIFFPFFFPGIQRFFFPFVIFFFYAHNGMAFPTVFFFLFFFF